MKHTSVITDSPCEFIDVTSISPLISKCHIKVCYVGDKPNRNGSVITEDVARQMANTLPGCAIVGYYNSATEDFEEHNRMIDISGGKFEIKDTTVPYGFVPLNAKCWFQTFVDDGDTIHKYLMTEGYLWTGQYPEVERVIRNGNNQSMELDENSVEGEWSDYNNGEPSFFIINEAVISKLCILGEDYEPCFEGSQITAPKFSLDNDEFKKQLFSMMQDIKDLLENNEEGGTQMPDLEDKNIEPITPEVQEPEQTEEAAASTEFAAEGQDPVTEPAAEGAEAPIAEEGDTTPTEPEQNEDENSSNGEGENVEDGNGEIQYKLEDIPEYVELSSKYSELESKYEALAAEKESLETEIQPLREFKLAEEKAKKVAMINSFTMLSEAEKADVVNNMDTYSLEDIEAKLSVICVRNKVNLSPETEEVSEKPAIAFSLEGTQTTPNASTPAWVKRALEVAKEME